MRGQSHRAPEIDARGGELARGSLDIGEMREEIGIGWCGAERAAEHVRGQCGCAVREQQIGRATGGGGVPGGKLRRESKQLGKHLLARPGAGEIVDQLEARVDAGIAVFVRPFAVDRPLIRGPRFLVAPGRRFDSCQFSVERAVGRRAPQQVAQIALGLLPPAARVLRQRKRPRRTIVPAIEGKRRSIFTRGRLEILCGHQLVAARKVLVRASIEHFPMIGREQGGGREEQRENAADENNLLERSDSGDHLRHEQGALPIMHPHGEYRCRTLGTVRLSRRPNIFRLTGGQQRP